MFTIPKEFTVKRSKWVNGDTKRSDNPSSLLNYQGNMCCVGFLAKACGLEDDMIEDRGILSDSIADKVIVGIEFDALNKAIDNANIYFLNDDRFVENREDHLTEVFASIGITIHFED